MIEGQMEMETQKQKVEFGSGLASQPTYGLTHETTHAFAKTFSPSWDEAPHLILILQMKLTQEVGGDCLLHDWSVPKISTDWDTDFELMI